jgi:hypothetical protein
MMPLDGRMLCRDTSAIYAKATQNCIALPQLSQHVMLIIPDR